jgi:phosphoglycolate phosphatase
MRILLWDIDGTLVTTGGVGVRALASVVHATEGAREALGRMRLDGMTDRRIARLLCAAERHRHAPHVDVEIHASAVGADEIDAMLTAYLSRLAEGLATDALQYTVLPGVVETLDALENEALHALGTGNLQEGARLKLTRGGLWHRFAFGGFGSDAEERAEILRAAWHKAERHQNRRLAPEDFVVIGDTPRDVQAAHDIGLCCVAVASGRHDIHELTQCGADDVLPNLAHPEAASRILRARRR